MGCSSGPGAGLYVVTGAFGYSGRYITSRLLNAGKRVRTLTNSLQRHNPFGTTVEAHPYNFDRPDELERSLRGAQVLVNTYWVRFDYTDFTHTQAVRNTLRLFGAAKRAGVPRVVHVSITNPSVESALPYFRGKAELESALRGSGLSYAILRPTVLFGLEDILINNIAWMLRRFPVFGVFGDGSYRLQPIFVDDLAQIAIDVAGSSENLVRDAVGPETLYVPRARFGHRRGHRPAAAHCEHSTRAWCGLRSPGRHGRGRCGRHSGGGRRPHAESAGDLVTAGRQDSAVPVDPAAPGQPWPQVLERTRTPSGPAQDLRRTADGLVERASSSKRARRSASDATSAGRTLTATSRPSRASRARYTSPMPPAPIGARAS